MLANIGGRKFVALVIITAVFIYFGCRDLSLVPQMWPYLIALYGAYFGANTGKDLLMEKFKNGKADSPDPQE